MTRLRVPKGQVFLKKEEKILRTLKDLDANHSDSDFTAVSEDMKYTFGGQDARTTRV